MTKPTIAAFKAFGADWTCRGFKYEVGQSYEHVGKIVLCEDGFHAVTVPFDAWAYYHGSHNLARVTLAGRMDGPNTAPGLDSKIAAAKITIEATLSLPEWVKAQAAAVIELCRAAKGALASKKQECAAATGDSGHAAATGYRGHAAATGAHAIAVALGVGGTAKAGTDGWIVLAAWGEWDGKHHPLLCVRSAKVGGPEGIKPDVAYHLTAAGEFVEAEGR